MKYELMIEDYETKDMNVISTKSVKKAKDLFFKYMMDYRVQLCLKTKYTCEVVIDNIEYWESIH